MKPGISQLPSHNPHRCVVGILGVNRKETMRTALHWAILLPQPNRPANPFDMFRSFASAGMRMFPAGLEEELLRGYATMIIDLFISMT